MSAELPVEVDGHHEPRAVTDGVGGRVDVEVVVRLRDVDQNWPPARLCHCLERRDERVRRHEHLVPGLDPSCEQAEPERIQAACHAHALCGCAVRPRKPARSAATCGPFVNAPLSTSCASSATMPSFKGEWMTPRSRNGTLTWLATVADIALSVASVFRGATGPRASLAEILRNLPEGLASPAVAGFSDSGL